MAVEFFIFACFVLLVNFCVARSDQPLPVIIIASH